MQYTIVASDDNDSTSNKVIHIDCDDLTGEVVWKAVFKELLNLTDDDMEGLTVDEISEEYDDEALTVHAVFPGHLKEDTTWWMKP